MVQILDKIAEFLNTKLDKLAFGVTETYSPAIYIAIAGAALILIGFFIALIATSCSKTKKNRAALEDVTAYINSVGCIDANNVEGLNQRINTLPKAVKTGWGNFLDQQTGYPSDYISEKNVVKEGEGKIITKAGKKFFNAISWIIIAIAAGFTALAYAQRVDGTSDWLALGLAIVGAIVAPIIVYIILRAILGGVYKSQHKKFCSAFFAFQDALDNNVLIFHEEQEEFVTENIEEINANIEEILANRLNGTELIDIVTTPTVEEDGEVTSYTEEELVAPIEVEEEEELEEIEPVSEEELAPIEEEIPAPEEVVAPVEEEPIVVEEPVVEEVLAEEPVVAEEPIAEEAPAEEPIIEEVIEEPVAEEEVAPIEEEPIVAEEPVVEEPIVVEEPAPIVEEPVAQEVGASADEAALAMGMSEEERRKGSHLVQLVYIADRASKDPEMTHDQILELAQYIYDAKVSGDYPSEEEQEIFDACLTILANM